MKHFVNYLTIIGVFCLFVWVWIYGKPIFEKFTSKSTCDIPIKYQLVSIDPKFNISEDRVDDLLFNATHIWNDAYQKNIFEQDANADLKVYFVYDEKHEMLKKINSLNKIVNSQEKTIDLEFEKFEAQKAYIENLIKELDDEISYWNKRGGAPKDEYESLIAKRETLNKQIDQLNSWANQLNSTSQNYNSEIDQLNTDISQFNNSLVTEPEEGVYDRSSNKIEIYFYANENELVHTLSHEFGHAIGLDHNQNVTSIMYPITSETKILSAEDNNDLKAYCTAHKYWMNLLNEFVAETSIFFQNVAQKVAQF